GDSSFRSPCASSELSMLNCSRTQTWLGRSADCLNEDTSRFLNPHHDEKRGEVSGYNTVFLEAGN
ncbi:unnamed protein product, partial [Mycena citricolor]